VAYEFVENPMLSTEAPSNRSLHTSTPTAVLSALIRIQNDQKDHAKAYERIMAVLDTMIRVARP
jgi:hypothetical protein